MFVPDLTFSPSQSYGDESLRPVTIKQLLDWTEAFPGQDTIIDGSPLTQLTIVGQIRKINPQATNITYTLDDGTGTIDVKKWVDAEKSGDDGAEGFNPDMYVRVWGRLKSFNGKKHVGAHFMREVKEFDEVNYHLVEAAYVHLYLTKGAPTQGGMGGQQGGGGGDGMFVDGGAGAGGGGAGQQGGYGNANDRTAGMAPRTKMVYNYMLNAQGGGEGVTVFDMARDTGLAVDDVRRECEGLMDGGVLYTTVDDDTWAMLEV